jgi:hypothetical protein
MPANTTGDECDKESDEAGLKISERQQGGGAEADQGKATYPL